MKKISVTLILALVIGLLTGCGAARTSTEADYYTAETMAAAAYDGGYYNDAIEEAVEYEAPAEMKSMAGGVGGLGESGTNGSMETGEAEPLPETRKLIRTINMSLQTESFDELTNGILADVDKFGGYVENSNIYLGGYNSGSGRNADITVRIPAEKVDEFLSRTYENTYVVSRNESTEDVSLRYSDLETRLSTLEAERDRLQELIGQAEDIESIIALEERLSNIRYELESIHTSLRSYDNRVDYATVWFYITEVKKIEPPAEKGFGERIRYGFATSTEKLGSALEDFAVWFLSNILTILFILALIFGQVMIVLAIVKGAKKRHLKRKNKMAAKEAEQIPVSEQKEPLKQEKAIPGSETADRR